MRQLEKQSKAKQSVPKEDPNRPRLSTMLDSQEDFLICRCPAPPSYHFDDYNVQLPPYMSHQKSFDPRVIDPEAEFTYEQDPVFNTHVPGPYTFGQLNFCHLCERPKLPAGPEQLNPTAAYIQQQQRISQRDLASGGEGGESPVILELRAILKEVRVISNKIKDEVRNCIIHTIRVSVNKANFELLGQCIKLRE